MQTRRAHDDIKFMTILCPQILLGSQVYTTMMVLSHLKGAIRGIMGLCYMIYFQTPFINYLGLQIILFMEANWISSQQGESGQYDKDLGGMGNPDLISDSSMFAIVTKS